jgi:hypothetical protein
MLMREVVDWLSTVSSGGLLWTLMNFRFPYKAENFLINPKTISLSRRTRFRGNGMYYRCTLFSFFCDSVLCTHPPNNAAISSKRCELPQVETATNRFLTALRPYSSVYRITFSLA